VRAREKRLSVESQRVQESKGRSVRGGASSLRVDRAGRRATGRTWNRKLGTRSPTTPAFRQKSAGVIEKRGVKSLGSAKERISA